MRHPPRLARVAARVMPALFMTTVVACDIPTELPKWETLWVVPATTTTVAVGSLLPAGVGVSGDGTAFQMDLSPITIQRTVGQLCPPCAGFNGLVVPKPAFTATVTGTTPLPAGVLSATLASGEIRLQLTHNFSFDPLRPSASARGYIVVSATSGTAVLMRDSISGNETAMLAGQTIDRTVQFAGASLTQPVSVSVTIHSPAGDPIFMNSNQQLTVVATPAQLRLSQAQVQIANASIAAEDGELDFEDLDQDVTDRLYGGAILLTVTNPFDASGSVNVTISAPGMTTINRVIQVQPGVTDARVELSREELRSIIGRPDVRVRIAGAVSTPAGGTTVRPTDEIVVRTRLELTVGPLEDES